MFGQVAKGTIRLSAAGAVVRKCWLESPKHYRCALGEFVVMPNHVHGIIIIPFEDDSNEYYHVGVGHDPRLPRYSISDIVRGFKSASAREINIINRTPGRTIWQRGFYDHIIRDKDGLGNTTEYIRHNPLKWDQDRNNPYLK